MASVEGGDGAPGQSGENKRKGNNRHEGKSKGSSGGKGRQRGNYESGKERGNGGPRTKIIIEGCKNKSDIAKILNEQFIDGHEKALGEQDAAMEKVVVSDESVDDSTLVVPQSDALPVASVDKKEAQVMLLGDLLSWKLPTHIVHDKRLRDRLAEFVSSAIGFNDKLAELLGVSRPEAATHLSMTTAVVSYFVGKITSTLVVGGYKISSFVLSIMMMTWLRRLSLLVWTVSLVKLLRYWWASRVRLSAATLLSYRLVDGRSTITTRVGDYEHVSGKFMVKHERTQTANVSYELIGEVVRSKLVCTDPVVVLDRVDRAVNSKCVIKNDGRYVMHNSDGNFCEQITKRTIQVALLDMARDELVMGFQSRLLPGGDR